MKVKINFCDFSQVVNVLSIRGVFQLFLIFSVYSFVGYIVDVQLVYCENEKSQYM